MPHDQRMKNVVRTVFIIAACAFVLAALPAHADGFLIPWVGSAFGSNINHGQTTLGVNAGGTGGRILGGEVDFGWSAPGFWLPAKLLVDSFVKRAEGTL